MYSALRIGMAIAGAWGMPHAQTFDSASIKTAATGVRGYSIQPLPGRLSARNASLKQLVAEAYHVHDYQVEGGPKWMDTDHFDIEAKAPDADKPPSNAELMKMLQKLLADRFQVTVRHETKDQQIYILQPGKNGTKAKESKDPSVAPYFRVMQRHIITAVNAPMEHLTETLAWVLGRPVIDQSGLKAAYDYKLEWAPDDLQLRSDESPVQGEGSLPSLGSALQETLGLRLLSQKGPVEIINVEKADHPAVN
jgi:uncharacterized protein (TIGR03435 family)